MQQLNPPSSVEEAISIVESIPSVRHFAKKMGRHPMFDHDDCMQEARIAAWEMFQKFDPSRGVKFSTAVYRPAIGHMVDRIRKIDSWSRRKQRNRLMLTPLRREHLTSATDQFWRRYEEELSQKEEDHRWERIKDYCLARMHLIKWRHFYWRYVLDLTYADLRVLDPLFNPANVSHALLKVKQMVRRGEF